MINFWPKFMVPNDIYTWDFFRKCGHFGLWSISDWSWPGPYIWNPVYVHGWMTVWISYYHHRHIGCLLIAHLLLEIGCICLFITSWHMLLDSSPMISSNLFFELARYCEKNLLWSAHVLPLAMAMPYRLPSASVPLLMKDTRGGNTHTTERG